MTILFPLLAASALGTDLGTLADRLDTCLIARVNEFQAAKEAADVTVDAAFEACLREEADLRVGLQEFAKADRKLTTAQAKRVEQFSYDTAVNAARGRALVRLMKIRAANAQSR